MQLVRRFFTVWVTRNDGCRMPVLCKLGEKLELEDHWIGTYNFTSAGMILVLENREAAARGSHTV